jgi:hypothetical protein
MTEQEQKAVEEYAKKASQIDTLIISNSLNESVKAYNEGVHNGILMGAQFLDTLRKVSDHETKVGKAGKELVEKIELILNENRETDRFNRAALDWRNFHSVATEIAALIQPDNELLEALKHAKSLISLSSISDDAIINRAISNYEKTDQMTYSDYVRKDLALEFAARFYQLMTSARVDEYIGARKDVCVNDLFEEFIKTKEDE